MKILHFYGKVIITGWKGGKVCSAITVFEQRGAFIDHICSDTGPRFLKSHSKNRLI